MVELLTQLRRRVVICEAGAVAFNKAVIQQPKRLTVVDNPTEEIIDKAQECLRTNWNTAASNFGKVCALWCTRVCCSLILYDYIHCMGMQMVRDQVLVDYISMAGGVDWAEHVPQLHQIWDTYSDATLSQAALLRLRKEVAEILAPEVITPVWPASHQ